MAETTVKAVSTVGTILEVSTDGTVWDKMCPIKSYPALGGAPEQIEITDLEDKTQTFIPGVQAVDAMEFGANYTLDTYNKVKAKANTPLKYRLKMGEDGKDGIATWEGQHSVYVKEGEVNGAREMAITVSPSTEITIGNATT